MTSSDITYTPHLHLTKLPSNYRVWAQLMNDNLATLDAAVTGFITFQNLRGAWTNSTVYVGGDSVVDPDTAVIWRNAIDHTSSTIPRTFAEERALFPAYWTIYSTAGTGRGEWTGPGTTYAFNDFVTHLSQYAVCIVAHTSTADFDADVASGYWSVIVDLSTYLPLSGGTLTGPLVGTMATFSGLATFNGGLVGTTATMSGSIVSTGGVIRAGNPPTIGYVLLNPGGAANTGYVAFHQADNDRVGYIGFYNDRIGYTAELAGSFHQWMGPGPVEWGRLSGSATSATYQLGVGTEIGIIQLDATGTMYMRSQKAGTFTWLGGGGINSCFVGPTGIFPATTNTMSFGNGPNTWGAVYANSLVANNAAGNNRSVFFDTAALHRWGVRAGNTAESGSNVGSDFTIDRYSDAGGYIDSPISINRATGAISNYAATTVNVPFAYYGNINGNFYTHVANSNASAGAAAGYGMELSSIANGYALLLVNKSGGLPNLQLSLGAGLTDGFYLPPLTKGTTAAPGTNTTQIATTAFVGAAVATVGSGVFMAMNNAAWTPVIGVVPFANVMTGNSGGWFNTGTNRYTPPAGRYFLYAKITCFLTGSSGSMSMQIRKNGVALIGTNDTIAVNFQTSLIISGTLDANGTDFFDIYVSSLPAGTPSGSAGMNIFQAHPVSTV